MYKYVENKIYLFSVIVLTIRGNYVTIGSVINEQFETSSSVAISPYRVQLFVYVLRMKLQS